jgi:hypothetical protein
VKARLFILTAALALTSQGCALLNAATSGRLPTAEEAAAAKREADRLDLAMLFTNVRHFRH